MIFLKDGEKRLFERILNRMDQSFDPVENMMTEWRGKNGYHSRLEDCRVHGVVVSLEYACDLMGRGTSEDVERVNRILEKVLPLQDKNPESKTFGIWPYFLEETLEEMGMPDWNMADFNAKRLYYLLREHADKILPRQKKAAKEALELACQSIKRRNVGPGYSNISIMGAYVVMAGGEYLGNTKLQEYALKRMRELYDFNMEHGALQEYNSPSYTFIVLSDLAAVLSYIKNEEFLALARDLNDMVWRCLAEHFHYRTGQWAGPHSRLYGMLQNDQILMQIQRALDYRITLVDLEKEGLEECLPMCFFTVRSHCPEAFVDYFVQDARERFGYTHYLWTKDKREDDIAASYLTEDFTLGSFQKAIFWNQRRSHISYFGTRQEPVYCCMRCLHDFYDYSSGLHVTAQDKNRTLTAFGFGMDGGDAHPDLDKVHEGRIRAKDLRVRFEIGGGVSNVSIRQEGREFYVKIGERTLHISVPAAVLNGREARCCVTEDNHHVEETGNHREECSVKCVDIVLYEGEETEIDFGTLESCFGVIGFEVLHSKEAPGELPKVAVEGDTLTAVMGNLKVEAPVKAVTLQEHLHKTSAWVEGRNYLDLVEK